MPAVKCSRPRPADAEDYPLDVRDLAPCVWGWVLGEETLVVSLGGARVLAPALGVEWGYPEGRAFCALARPYLVTVKG